MVPYVNIYLYFILLQNGICHGFSRLSDTNRFSCDGLNVPLSFLGISDSAAG